MRRISSREYNAMSDYERGEYDEAADNAMRERRIEDYLKEHGL